MSSKLTVSRLRDELQKRGLDTTGLKPVLASRLDEAIAEEEAASKDGHKDGANGEKRKRSSDSPPDEEESRNHAKRLKVEDVSGMTAKQLKEALSQRCLSTSGKKGELAKRLTEALEAKNGTSTNKNAPKDDRDAQAVVLKKGRDVLDQYIDARIKNSFHVYEGMLNCKLEVFDAMLNQKKEGENNNRFYVLQILVGHFVETTVLPFSCAHIYEYFCHFIEADAGKKYYLFLRWGRVGVKGQQKLLGPWGNALPAVAEFMDKFYDKTSNFWYARHPFVAHPNKYTWIE